LLQANRLAYNPCVPGWRHGAIGCVWYITAPPPSRFTRIQARLPISIDRYLRPSTGPVSALATTLLRDHRPRFAVTR
jgi:hypothetical protein